MSQLVGAWVDICGKVQKCVKRDGQCKLVIQPDDESGFVVFADCQPDAKIVIKRKIRKGSLVSVRGKLQAFGASAVCLKDCCLEKREINRKRSLHAHAESLKYPLYQALKKERK